MPTPLAPLVVLVVFGSVIALVVVRPRGWHEAWWTCAGAAVLLALGLVHPKTALSVAASGSGALLFLFGLLLLAVLAERSGFFSWAALVCAHMARGDGRALYRNVFLLGAMVTAVLSLDTTAVMLTPIVLAFVARLRLPARPYVFACAYVANTGSLLLPMSNLTNLMVLHDLGESFGGFTLRMIVPQILVLGSNYLAFRFWFRRELPDRYDTNALPAPGSAVKNPRFFGCTCAVVALVCIGSFLASSFHLPPSAVAIGGAVSLAVAGKMTDGIGLSFVREAKFGVFPFVLGLFVIVSAVEDLGVSRHLTSLLPHGPHTALADLAVTGTAAALSNSMNNLPAVLLSMHALRGTPRLLWYALAGTNVGTCLTTFGSLATLLVLSVARGRGFEIRARDLLLVGFSVTPLLLVAAWAGLALQL